MRIVERFAGIAFAIGVAAVIAGCSQIELAPHLQPISNETMMLLGKKGMSASSPVFVRIFKEDSELEVWKQREDGHFYHFKTYPICNWSGGLGPKVSQGDMQAPEGFYAVSQSQMNPNSQFHLALNLGYPNAYDKANRRTGEFLMVHGRCKSAGCYAMTDALIEEIYALAREAFIGGQEIVWVHAFPFRMTEENMQRYKANANIRFWRTLKEGYDYFEETRQMPNIAVCERRYIVNVDWPAGSLSRLNPEGACPVFHRLPIERFTPAPGDRMVEERVVVPGPKMRAVAENASGGPGTIAAFTNRFGRMFGLGLSSSGFGFGR